MVVGEERLKSGELFSICSHLRGGEDEESVDFSGVDAASEFLECFFFLVDVFDLLDERGEDDPPDQNTDQNTGQKDS